MFKVFRLGIAGQFFATLSCCCMLSLTQDARAEQSPSLAVSSPADAAKKSQPPWFEGFHENWKSITLEGSTLKPQKPILVDKVDLPDKKNTREHVQLVWRPGDTVDLYLVRPKDVQKPPVVLYLYTYPESGDRFKNDVWYHGTAVEGYAAVGFVSAITAERAGNRGPDETFVGLLPEALASSVHDVQLILDYLGSRGDLDMDRVGMFGTGSGGAIAILASAADARIKTLDVLNPWGDWPDWTAKTKLIVPDHRDKFVDAQFLALVAPLDPVQWLSKVKAESIRIENVRKDFAVPEEVQRKIEEAAPDRSEINEFADYPTLISVMPGAGIFSWARRELQLGAKSRMVADKSKRVRVFPTETKRLDSYPARP